MTPLKYRVVEKWKFVNRTTDLLTDRRMHMIDDEKIRLQIERDKALFLIVMGVFFIAMGVIWLILFAKIAML